MAKGSAQPRQDHTRPRRPISAAASWARRGFRSGRTTGDGSGLGALVLPIAVSLWFLPLLQLSEVRPRQLLYRIPVEGFPLGGFSAMARGNCKKVFKASLVAKGGPVTVKLFLSCHLGNQAGVVNVCKKLCKKSYLLLRLCSFL